jgi:FtsH-binding integral membrane protein
MADTSYDLNQPSIIDVKPENPIRLSLEKWQFIAKTFGIVGVQLFVTFIIAYGCYVSSSVRSMNVNQYYALIITMMVFAIVSMFATFALVYQERLTYALIPFTIFTLCMAVIFGIGCVAYEIDVILQSVFIVFSIVISCVAYVLVTKRNLHEFHGILYTGLSLLILTSLIFLFFPPSNKVNIVYSVLGIIIFTGYLLVDTSDLIHHYKEGEELIAAMGLYLDILNLLLKVMELIKSCKEDK